MQKRFFLKKKKGILSIHNNSEYKNNIPRIKLLISLLCYFVMWIVALFVK